MLQDSATDSNICHFISLNNDIGYTNIITKKKSRNQIKSNKTKTNEVIFKVSSCHHSIEKIL